MITALVASNLGELRRKEAASLLVQCRLFDLATAWHLRYVIVFLPPTSTADFLFCSGHCLAPNSFVNEFLKFHENSEDINQSLFSVRFIVN